MGPAWRAGRLARAVAKGDWRFGCGRCMSKAKPFENEPLNGIQREEMS